MARSFAGGASTDSVNFGNYAAINSLTTLTISCFVYAGALDATSRRVMAKANTTAVSDGLFILSFSNTTTCFFAATNWSGTIGLWEELPAPALNTWEHWAVTYDYGSTSNVPIVYQNAVSQSYSTTTAPTGSTSAETVNLGIGNRGTGTQDRAWIGRIAETAIWNAILNENEILALSRGRLPHGVRPGSLVFYAPLGGTHTAEPNYKSSGTGTVTGAALANHAPVAPMQLSGAQLPFMEGFSAANNAGELMWVKG
jgi:hypothetical protein